MSSYHNYSLRENVPDRQAWVLNSVPVMLWAIGLDGTIVFANRACCECWGQSLSRITGRKMEEVLGSQATVFRDSTQQALISQQETSLDVELECAGNERKWLNVSTTLLKNGNNQLQGVAYTAVDVTDRKRTEEDLRLVSVHDSLTGLYNRVYFEEELRRLDSGRFDPVSIIYCDLNGLKIMNDVFGHSAGDELIISAANFIRSHFRVADVVARVGGDEFAVLLPLTDFQTAETISRRIEQGEAGIIEQGALPLSISAGFASTETVDGDIYAVYREADRRMYQQKYRRRDLVKRETVNALLQVLQEKDYHRSAHLPRLFCLVMLMGQALGLDSDAMGDLLLLSEVHDIGYLGLSETTIFATQKLDSKQWEEMQGHPELGYRLASLSPDLAHLAESILQHHEHWDGSGYPRGVKGENINIYARIIALVDAYEAMTSPRPYRLARTNEEALAELQNCRGKKYDPHLTDLFFALPLEDCDLTA